MNTSNGFKENIDIVWPSPYNEDMAKLNNISEIRTGYNLRSSIRTEQQTVFLISAKELATNFVETGKITIPKSFKNYLRDGDILVKSRGTSYEAKVFKAHRCEYPYVAANTLIVIRLRTDNYKPAYIAQIINSSDSQRFLRSLSLGQTLPSLSPVSLGALSCPEMSPEKQKQLEKIIEIMNDYRACLSQYQKTGETLTSAIEQQLMKGAK